MQKVDLWSCDVGDEVTFSIDVEIVGRSIIIRKETLPAGYGEMQLVKVRTIYGVEHDFDCAEKSYIVALHGRNARPANISIEYGIKARPSKPIVVNGVDLAIPVGHIPESGFIGSIPGDYLPVDHRVIKVEEYPELYNVVGDAYSIERKIVEFTPSLIERVKKLFKIKFTPRTYTVETRTCGDHEFRLPDLRGQFIRGI